MKKILSVVLTIVMTMSLLTIAPNSVCSASYEYAMYPGDVLQMTQGAYGEYNAYSHNGQTGYYQNAFDMVGNAVYKAPFTGTIIKIGTSLNVVAIASENKVYWADGTLDYLTVYFMHDNNISDITDGARITQGTSFYHPGTAGGATGSHLHIYARRGRLTSKNMYSGSGDVYVNKALYIKNTTKIVQTGGYSWKTVSTGNNPIGGIDGVSSPSLGKITVIGWAYDPDDTSAQIDVHIYVGGPAGSGEKHIVKANTYQKSVDDTYHCGLYHGFFATFDTKKSGNQPIYAYGINIGGGTTNSQLYGVPATVFINTDTEKPQVSDITVSQISSNGYRVTCRVSDNVGVTSVKFPSWEQHVGASDVKWHEGTLSGDNKIGSCYIPLSEHNNVKGDYLTHIYPYDGSGNYCSVSTGNIKITDEPLLINSTEYNGNTYKVFNSGKTWTEAKKWCENNGGHLATITDENEWNAVKSALEKYNGVPCWLGAESTSGTLKWVTGESLTYTNWSSGQPDCAGKNEFYLGTFNDSKKWLDCYLWNDYSNDGASRIGGFVCEFEQTIQNSSTTTNPTKPTTTEPKPTITETVATSPTVPTSAPVTTKPAENKTTLTLSRYFGSIYVTGTAIIKPTVKNGKGVTTYKSSNTRVAKVDSRGKLTALKAGTARITITNNKVSKVFTVKVLNPKLNKTSVSISRGKSYTLKITGKIGTAKFYTSNKKIATVNSKGKITVNKKAKRGSTVTITVKTNGITLKCKVKVK